MMQRKPLGEIIERVPALRKGKDDGYLRDTIHLEESIRPENREETVRLYYFPKTIKTTFKEILSAFSEPTGRGFWLTAEYGVGKSHFLATLACLLSDSSEKIWECLHDKDIQNYRFHFQKRRLFPVVFGLRGKTAISPDRPITLLDQLDREIYETITQLGLSEKILITPVAETLKLFDEFDTALQGVIQNYIQQKSGKKPSELRKIQPDRFADLVRHFLKDQNLPFEPKVSINERLQFLYKQIVESKSGFNGLLFVIDEFESWLAQRPITSSEGMFDSSVLQALTEILPIQHNYEIFTVIASQTNIPAQLHGRGRFKSLPLLAGSGAERDYHVICAHRVRRYKEGTEAEAKKYYHDFYNEFAMYKDETEESFLETFPFHPLAYETVRRFTSSVQDMPQVRLGLNIFYDVVKSEQALQVINPITLYDVHQHSPNLQNALSGLRFGSFQRRYLDAVSLLPKIFPADEEDRKIAEAILATLYLQFVISGGQTMPLSMVELADATLTPTGAITGEQRMLVLLSDMVGKIPQIDFDPKHPEKGARFNPLQEGPSPQLLLEEYKGKGEFSDTDNIMECWEKLLFISLAEARGQKALFSNCTLEKAWKEKVVVNQITYEGEILVARSWRKDLGNPIADPYCHFRLIYLLNPSPAIASDLQDPRIIVVEAALLSEKVRELCQTYLAAQKLMKDFGSENQKGPEAAGIRSFAETKHFEALSEIICYQLEPYQKGKAYTKEGINLDLGSAFMHTTPDKRHSALVSPTIKNAYQEFSKIFEPNKIDKPVDSTDAKNLFIGLVQGDISKTVRSTLEQKSVGLGLTLPNDPKKLSPHHSQFFKLLDQRLATNPAIPLWPLMKELAGYPYGIPPYLFTSLLLIYARSRAMPSSVEIQLQPQHNITNQSGQKISINRITRANSVGLRWQPEIERFFDSLVAVAGLDLNTLYPFVKLIYPDARLVTAPHDIDQQIEHFLEYMKDQSPLVKSAAENLRILAEVLGESLSQEDMLSFNRMIDLFASEDLEAFDAKRKVIGHDVATFKPVVERVDLLRKLTAKSSQIIQMYDTLKQSDVGSEGELLAQKSMLLVRFKLSSMIGNETAVSALLNETEKFLEKLRNAQDIHAKRMRDELTKLKESLTSLTSAYIEGLGKLNQITTLGPPQGHDLADRFDKLLENIGKELSGASNLHQSLSYRAPEPEVKELQYRIKQAFENRAGVLRSQLEKLIQEKGTGNNLKTLFDLLRINKLHDAAINLTPAVIETLRKVLEEARTQVVRSRALDRLIEQFPAVSQEDIESFLTQLRKVLEEEFREKSEEGKRILLSFK